MTQLYAELAIYGKDLVPGTVTSALNIEPTVQWHRGDLRSLRAKSQHENGCWKLKTGDNASPLEEHIQILMMKLSGVDHLISNLASKHDWEVELAVVVHLNGNAPDISLGKTSVAWINRLGASIDIDIYL